MQSIFEQSSSIPGLRRHLSALPERLLAYALAISPPIAVLLALIQLARRWRSVSRLRQDLWTAASFGLLALLGTISFALADSQLLAWQGPAAIAILFMFWLAGWSAVEKPERFWRDLQRGIGIVAAVTFAWILKPFDLKLPIGGLTLPIASPHDPVAVFGLGANGLGPLLVFGAVLAMGRLSHDRGIPARLEALALATVALGSALAIGVRSALWGASAGAATVLLAGGPLSLAVVSVVTAITLWLQPWPNFWDILSLQSRSIEVRLKVWASALRMVRDHPWFGVGPFHFLQANNRYMAGDPDLQLGLGVHNIYLRMASEWGLPAAFVLYAWLLSWPFRLWHRRSEIWRWSLVAGLIAFLAMGLFDDPLFTLHVSAPVFLGIGLAASSEKPADAAR